MSQKNPHCWRWWALTYLFSKFIGHKIKGASKEEGQEIIDQVTQTLGPNTHLARTRVFIFWGTLPKCSSENCRRIYFYWEKKRGFCHFSLTENSLSRKIPGYFEIKFPLYLSEGWREKRDIDWSEEGADGVSTGFVVFAEALGTYLARLSLSLICFPLVLLERIWTSS